MSFGHSLSAESQCPHAANLIVLVNSFVSHKQSYVQRAIRALWALVGGSPMAIQSSSLLDVQYEV